MIPSYVACRHAEQALKQMERRAQPGCSAPLCLLSQIPCNPLHTPCTRKSLQRTFSWLSAELCCWPASWSAPSCAPRLLDREDPAHRCCFLCVVGAMAHQVIRATHL
eukprot:1161965-Pelagomonas_calceolata.AAC.14